MSGKYLSICSIMIMFWHKGTKKIIEKRNEVSQSTSGGAITARLAVPNGNGLRLVGRNDRRREEVNGKVVPPTVILNLFQDP